MAHMGPHACTRRGRKGSKVADHDELVLMAMADTHGGDACSRTDAVVAVKRATALASQTYGDVQPRERKVREALVVAGHG